MTGVIYCLTSPSGKKYVGKTINYRTRMNNHYTARLDPSKNHYPLYLAINKYGWDSFVKEKLAENIDDGDMLNILECEFIAKFKQSGIVLYNLTEGGEGTPGWSPNDRFRKEKGQTMLNLWADPDYHARQCQSRKAAWTEEMREAVSARSSGASNIKAKLSEEQVRDIVERLKTDSAESLALIFGVEKSTIHRIKSGRTWKYIERPNYENLVVESKPKYQQRIEFLEVKRQTVKNSIGIIKQFLIDGYRSKHVAIFGDMNSCSVTNIKNGKNYVEICPVMPSQDDYDKINKIVAENPIRGPRKGHGVDASTLTLENLEALKQAALASQPKMIEG